MNTWRFAFRNLWRNRRRSGLTIAIVVFGFASFALAGGFMAQTFVGLKESTISSGVGHLQLATTEAFEGSEQKTLEHGIRADGSVAAILKADPRVAAVLPRLEFVGLASNGARSIPCLGLGMDGIEEGRVMDTKSMVSAGRWLDGRDEMGVLLGTGLAKALSVRPGDAITVLATTTDGVLNAVDLNVIGLLNIPIKELNDRYLATTVAAAGQLLGAGDVVSRYVVMLKDERQLESARTSLVKTLAAAGVRLEGRTWVELAAFYRQVRMLYVAIFGFMGLILVTMVLLACANTMTMAASERTREIGTLRAIGTPPSGIQHMFMAEGVLLGVFGSLCGAVLALLIRAVLNASHIELPPPPGGTSGGVLHVAFFIGSYAIGLVSMVLTLAMAAWLPARRASRRPIVEALLHV